MAKSKSCRPTAKVRQAGRTLAKTRSKPAKSKAGKTLNNHKKSSH